MVIKTGIVIGFAFFTFFAFLILILAKQSPISALVSSDIGLRVSIDPEYMFVEKNKEILAEVFIYNLGAGQRTDFFVNYGIRDMNGETITLSHQTVAVQTSASFLVRENVPDIPRGYYTFYAEVFDENGDLVSRASKRFYVVRTRSKLENLFFPEGLAIIIIGLLILVTVLHYEKKILARHMALYHKVDPREFTERSLSDIGPRR